MYILGRFLMYMFTRSVWAGRELKLQYLQMSLMWLRIKIDLDGWKKRDHSYASLIIMKVTMRCKESVVNNALRRSNFLA